MDPVEGAALGVGAGMGIAKAGRQALARVLGPSLDEIGAALGRYTEMRLRNVGRIAEKAARKLGSDEGAGAVPPRVAHRILDDGSYCEDEVMLEYLAGVLAGSRSADGQDDRGVVWADMVSGMSAAQVRAHYLIYELLRRAGSQQVPVPPYGLLEDRQRLRVFVPMEGYADYTGLDDLREAQDIGSHAVSGLHRLRLVGEEWGVGAGVLRHPQAQGRAGLDVEPTLGGVELFMWAHGLGTTEHMLFLEDESSFSIDPPIPIPAGCAVGMLPTAPGDPGSP